MGRAPSYLHGHGKSVVAAHAARTAGDAAAFILPQMRSPMRVLDVGCGPGTISVGLAEAVAPAGSVLGVDVSDALRPEWDKRMAECETGNLEFRIADIFGSDLPSEHFDVVYMHQVLQHLPNPVDALGAAVSHARDGALVGVREVDWGTFATYPESDGMREFRRIYDAVAIGNGGNPHAGRHLLRWFNEVGGLADVRVTTSTWTFFDAAGKEWWANQWSERVVESNIARGALDMGIATMDELQAVASAWQRWKQEPDAVSAFTHFEALATVSRG